MTYFDPSEYIKGIQQLLISDKKKIGFLCGAGTSLAKKNNNSKVVPAVGQLTIEILDELKTDLKYKVALDEVEIEIKEKYGDKRFNIETLLSNVEEKKAIIGKGELNGLKIADFMELSNKIKTLVHSKVSVHKEITEYDYENLIHNDFAKWIVKADRQCPIEIFTTNYDYLFELGLECNNAPYYDGFVGSFNPFFYSDSIDSFEYLPKQTKLWKIHGSLGWKELSGGKVIRTCEDDKDIMIYPSSTKYENSKKMPYTALMDRLCNYLKQQDTVMFVCGYSFNDEHINERILAGLRNNNTSHVFVFMYDIVWEGGKKTYTLTENSDLGKIALSNSRISVLGCKNAIIGGQYGIWKLKREPDKDETISVNYYFDEDAPIKNEIPLNEEKHCEEDWTGLGELILPNFSKLVKFLQSVTIEWRDEGNYE